MDKEIDLLNRQKFVEDVITLVRQLSENQKGCCSIYQYCIYLRMSLWTNKNVNEIK